MGNQGTDADGWVGDGYGKGGCFTVKARQHERLDVKQVGDKVCISLNDYSSCAAGDSRFSKVEHSVVDRSLAAKGVKPKALAEHIAEVKRKAL